MRVPIRRRIVGWALVVLGILALGWYGFDTFSQQRWQQQASAAFDRAPGVDRSGDGGRGAAFPSPVIPASGILGRMEIPRLAMSVMIKEGDDDATLDVAAGHLPDTVLPWQSGNSALAGHRDTLFRPLKDIRIGDAITLQTIGGTFQYLVSDTRIVSPESVGVLAPTLEPVLTLVTCYPFQYIGHAPERFIVRADRLPVD